MFVLIEGEDIWPVKSGRHRKDRGRCQGNGASDTGAMNRRFGDYLQEKEEEGVRLASPCREFFGPDVSVRGMERK